MGQIQRPREGEKKWGPKKGSEKEAGGCHGVVVEEQQSKMMKKGKGQREKFKKGKKVGRRNRQSGEVHFAESCGDKKGTSHIYFK